MDTLAPAKAVASVSLADADRDPEGFSQKLGRSFERYGFAIVADHGIPDALIQRAEEKAKAKFSADRLSALLDKAPDPRAPAPAAPEPSPDTRAKGPVRGAPEGNPADAPKPPVVVGAIQLPGR